MIPGNKNYLRIIHHWPCSGGTVISKCIAALPNIIFLSEIHPYAYLRFMKEDEKSYLPTDLIQQLSFKRNGRNSNLCNSAFRGAICEINNSTYQINKILVLRDHSHIDFFVGPLPRNESLICQLFADKYDLLRILTVRHPLDSWLSIKKNNWDQSIQFNSFDEFCSRIKYMLKAMKDVPIIYYEKFCVEPNLNVKKICQELKLSFEKSFLNKFHSLTISGDSGRGGKIIKPRERRESSMELKKEIHNSQNYIDICRLLNYDIKYDADFPYLIN